jgi:hypothetical protein
MTSEHPTATREQLKDALGAAHARLGAPGSSGMELSAGVIESDLSDAARGTPELLEEIATLERALNEPATDDGGDPGIVMQ